MISVFGDESSSTAYATFGLLAVADGHLSLLDKILTQARSALGATRSEPLHCRTLFHGNHRAKSAFAGVSQTVVERTCEELVKQVSALEVAFFHGRVDRTRAPKIMYVPLVNTQPELDADVLDARLKLELSHLQFLAYGAAVTRAVDALPRLPTRLMLDRNKTMIRWFNESRQANRLVELFSLGKGALEWAPATFADDADHSGLQVADVLTYYGTRQLSDRRFAAAFNAIRHKSTFLQFDFAEQARRPYVPPPNVAVTALPKRR